MWEVVLCLGLGCGPQIFERLGDEQTGESDVSTACGFIGKRLKKVIGDPLGSFSCRHCALIEMP
jgi:hypothetical protein